MATPLSETEKIANQIKAQRDLVKAQLLDHLLTVPPYEFEHLVSHLLEAMSFTDCEVTQQYKDGGIDLKANFSIGISEIRTIGQVKRLRASVGSQALQQFYGVLVAEGAKTGVHLGLYVTTSSFSATAVNWVDASNLPIVLIDGAKLVDLMVQHGLLVTEVPMPPALALMVPKGEQPPTADPKEAAEPETVPGPEGQRGKTTFKWNLQMQDDDSFVLRAVYLPDPSRVLEVRGVRAPADRNFRPARAKLQDEIAAWVGELFPDLSTNLVRAKAWSGTHRVYPAAVYGK